MNARTPFLIRSIMYVFGRIYNSGPTLLCLCTLFWAGNFVVGRSAVQDLPPVIFSQIRWIVATSILLPIAWKFMRKDWSRIRSNLPILVCLSILGVSSFNTLAYIGLTHTSAVSGVIMQPAAPVLICLTGAIFFRDKISIQQIIAVTISCLGVIHIAVLGQWTNATELSFGIGELFLATAFLVWALYSNLLRLRPQMHDLSFICSTFVIGNICLLPLTLWEMQSVEAIAPSGEMLLSIAYVGFFPSLVSYLFYNRGVHLIGSTKAGMFIQLVPVYGIVLAWIFLGENLQWFQGVGLATILAGLWLTLFRFKSKNRQPDRSSR